MQTSTVSQMAEPASISRALVTVLLPGPLEKRARAAASLPAWLTPLFVACMLPALAETIYYTGQTIGKYEQVVRGYSYDLDPATISFPRLEPGKPTFGRFMAVAGENCTRIPVVLPDALRHDGPYIAIAVYAFTLLLLEVLNLAVLVPFGASFGQGFFQAEPLTRNIMFSLGSLWVLQSVFAWALIAIFLGPLAYCTVLLNGSRNLTEGFNVVITGVSPPLLLGVVCLLRLIRASSRLATVPSLPLQARCGRCGYFLEGLAEGASCPECGMADPQRPDELRQPTAWVHRRQVGWFRSLFQPIIQVLVIPRRLFGRMETLSHASDARRFLAAALCVGVCTWVIGIPGMALATSHRPNTSSEQWENAFLVAPVIAVLSALIGLVVFCLMICLMGILIGRAREEPAWPIAANAGCYLAGLFPWVIAAQALWLIVFFGMGDANRWDMVARHLQAVFHVPWPLIFVLILVLPTILGIGLAIHTAVICYRHVRYACR